MNCEYHKNIEADFTCIECGVGICKNCAVSHNGNIICIECARKKGIPIINNTTFQNNQSAYNTKPNYNTKNYTKKYSTFWSIVFSFIPGGGHMYIGLMKRGLQFMLLFFGILSISSLFYSADFLFFFATVVWFYSFFDCFHMRRKLERNEIVDEDLFFSVDVKNINRKYLGTGLIALGGLVLLNEFLDQLIYFTNKMNINSESVRVTIRLIRDSIFPVVLIVIGCFILKKAKKSS
mgnify:FL=1